ncbi:hypothetical protein [Microvirga yunnanensis]|nr:hypothetical protein [Microvirga sp. HBU65207]
MQCYIATTDRARQFGGICFKCNPVVNPELDQHLLIASDVSVGTEGR